MLEIPQRNRDSLLVTLMRWNRDGKNQYCEKPITEMISRLAVDDIVIPDMRHTVKFAELMDEYAVENQRKWYGNPCSILSYLYSPKSPKSLKSPGKYMPRALLQRYEKLTPSEQAAAFEESAPDACLVTADRQPALYSRFQEIFSRAGIARDQQPRIIRIDSDWPSPAFLDAGPARPYGTIIFSSNTEEILSDTQFNAAILHELGHYEKRVHRTSLREHLDRWVEPLTLNYTARREEHFADGIAAKYGSQDDAVEVLMKISMRCRELNRFRHQLKELLNENGIEVYEEPKGLLGRFLDKHRLREEHPTFPRRFDHIYNSGR